MSATRSTKLSWQLLLLVLVVVLPYGSLASGASSTPSSGAASSSSSSATSLSAKPSAIQTNNNDEWSILSSSTTSHNDLANPNSATATTSPNNDILKIHNLELRCYIGFNPHEIGKLQKVLLSASFQPPLGGKGSSYDMSHDDNDDNVRNTIDLRTLSKDLLQFEHSQINLIETLAYRAAYVTCVVNGGRNVEISIKKPGSLRFSEGTEVLVGPYDAKDFPKYNAIISIGSNIDPFINIPRAIHLLRSHGIGIVRNKSHWYRSSPVGSQTEGDPDFINAAIHIETRLLPSFLERALKQIEVEMGRVRDPNNKNAPRQIDLDVTYFGRMSEDYNDGKQTGLEEDSPAIVLDHEGLAVCPHVAMPVADLFPNWRPCSLVDATGNPTEDSDSEDNKPTLKEIVSSFDVREQSLPTIVPDSKGGLWTMQNGSSATSTAAFGRRGGSMNAVLRDIKQQPQCQEERPVALVTGGTSKIGRDIVRHLHQEGYNVAIHCNSDIHSARNAASTLNKLRTGSAYCIRADLSDPDSAPKACDELVNAVLQRFGGRLDLLVNNASCFEKSSCVLSHNDAGSLSGEWSKHLTLNLSSPVFLARAAFAPLSRMGGGSIVNIADIHGVHPLEKNTMYSTSKAGLIMATKGLAQEMASSNVRVNGINPGAIEWVDPPPSEEYRNSVLEKVPLQRMGDKGDISSSVLFLAKNQYITGEVITIDGGRTSLNPPKGEEQLKIKNNLLIPASSSPKELLPLSDNKNDVAAMYDGLLRSFGYDPDQSRGIQKTPMRAAKAMDFLLSGTRMKVEDVLNGAIFDVDEDEDDDRVSSAGDPSRDMVVVHGITFYSLCEHHLLPFFGQVHIAYIPRNGKVLGLSKLPRIVQVFSRRLQVQERLTKDIASAIEEAIGARGVAVSIDARHMCVEMRGVEQCASTTSTRFMLGDFEKDPRLVAEFYDKISLSRDSSRR